MRTGLAAILFALWGSAAAAAPMNWELSYDDGTVFGQVGIDFSTGTVSGVIPGQFGTYSGTGFAQLDTRDFIGSYPVQDFFKLFDPASGTTYVTDYGNGEQHSYHLNEAAIEVGTLGTALLPQGGRFAVIIREILNYDESYTYCSYYEDLYDENGEWIGQGACQQTYSDSYYNQGYDDYYTGYLSYTPVDPPPPPVAPVPLPAGVVLLAGGLLALSAVRRCG